MNNFFKIVVFSRARSKNEVKITDYENSSTYDNT